MNTGAVKSRCTGIPVLLFVWALATASACAEELVYDLWLEPDAVQPAYADVPVKAGGAQNECEDGGALHSGKVAQAIYSFYDEEHDVRFGFTLKLGGRNPGGGEHTSSSLRCTGAGFGVGNAFWNCGETAVLQIIDPVNITRVSFNGIRIFGAKEIEFQMGVDTDNDGFYNVKDHRRECNGWLSSGHTIVLKNLGGNTGTLDRDVWKVSRIGFRVTVQVPVKVITLG